jgi:anti-anti-sigma factor
MPEFDNTKHVELDFAELVYVSSAGLRVLLMGEKTSKTKGAKMTIANVSADIMEVFDMTGFADILTII